MMRGQLGGNNCRKIGGKNEKRVQGKWLWLNESERGGNASRSSIIECEKRCLRVLGQSRRGKERGNEEGSFEYGE